MWRGLLLSVKLLPMRIPLVWTQSKLEDQQQNDCCQTGAKDEAHSSFALIAILHPKLAQNGVQLQYSLHQNTSQMTVNDSWRKTMLTLNCLCKNKGDIACTQHGLKYPTCQLMKGIPMHL